FGIAVSGMHYTAIEGMRFVCCAEPPTHHLRALATSPQTLALVVAVFCFVIAAGFLLSLVPDPRRQVVPLTAAAGIPGADAMLALPQLAGAGMPAAAFPWPTSAPLGGVGQPPRPPPAPRLPVEGADGTHFIDSADVRSVRADAHYTK